MQFVITAYDFKDSEALNRRLANREAHLKGIKTMIQAGSFLSGGAILNDEGTMVGSSVHVQFDNREQLDQWLASDPYITGKVWETVDIQEIKLVPLAF